MPRISWKLGRVAGIDLFLNPTFLILPAWGYFEHGLPMVAMIVAVFGCILLHELGHALTARAYGIPTRDITLYPFGGLARLERMPKAAGPELLITLAGPLVNVAIAATIGLVLYLTQSFPVPSPLLNVVDFVTQLMIINLLLAVFNMVPAFPMDGGRVLRAALTNPLGRYRATEIAAGISRFIAVAFGCYALFYGGFMQVILAAFVFYAASIELLQVRRDEYERRFGSDGISIAPPGFHWVDRGNGFWQAAPIHVQATSGETRSWS